MMSGAVPCSANASPGEESEYSVKRPSARPRAQSVLLVDDATLIRNLAQELLSEAGYEAYSAQDGITALGFLKSRERPIDVVITDLTMPVMNGFELIRELRQLSPATKVVLITGYIDAVELAGRSADQPDLVLPKPFRPTELLHAVSDVLALPR